MMRLENFRVGDATFENVLESVTSVANRMYKWDIEFYDEMNKMKTVIRNVAIRYEQADIHKRPVDLPFLKETMDHFEWSFLRMSRQMAAQNVIIRPVLDQCCEFLLLGLKERGFCEPEEEIKIKMNEIQTKILLVAQCNINRALMFKIVREKLKIIVEREGLQSLCPYLCGRLLDDRDFDRIYLYNDGDNDTIKNSGANSGGETKSDVNGTGDKANAGFKDGVIHGANVAVTDGFGVDVAKNDVADGDIKEDLNNVGMNSDADIGDNANDDVIVGAK